MKTTTVSKPQKTIVSAADARAWRGGELLIQQKMDGEFATMEDGGWRIAGERMRDGRFYAFDCLASGWQDISAEPTRVRFQELKNAIRTFNVQRPTSNVQLVPVYATGAFLDAVFAAGGEGLVAKAWDAPYGPMLACKRIWEGLCVVAEFCGGSQAVKIADAGTGADRGRVCLFGGKVDQVRVGSVLKVQGMELTARGLVREPRLCKDTPTSWLVRF